ncbi:MAG: HlyC/CorC family transporter [Nanoarchaeota archaeon]|nr:HlyC/CorC family transporter [Nanoarchaeota archaeon]
MEIIFFVIFVILIIILSGIVSGSEAAILSISYTKAKELARNFQSNLGEKNINSIKLLRIKEDLQRYISTIVILNNIINVVGSVYVGVLANKIFGEFYLGIVSAILTFLIIMFSELIPKIYGEKHSETIALFVAGPLIFLTKLFTPLIYLLNSISAFFVRGKVSKKVSEGEIREMANLGYEEGSINTYENRVIKNVFRMNDIEVFEIMIPKNRVTVIDSKSNFDEIVKIVEKTGYTRFPISEGGEIVGLINAKDLFKYNHIKSKFKIFKILRPIIFAPEVMKIKTLEEKLRKERIHLAVIVNEFGDFTGIASLEDIIEELLGDIEDEFDKNKEASIQKISNGKYHILGRCQIDLINTVLDLNISDKDDYTTLNGFLISKLDRIPKVNDKLKIPQKGEFRVINSSIKKVLKVEYIVKK